MRSGGDRDFCRKVREAGFPFRHEPALLVRHPARGNFSALAYKALRTGHGQAEIFLLTAPTPRQLAVKLLRTALALVLQPQQWRLLRQAWREAPLGRLEMAGYAAVLFATGALHRGATLVGLVHRGLRNRP